MADTVNAGSWRFVLAGGGRSTRSDPYRGSIIPATREGSARIVRLFGFIQMKCFSFPDTNDALTLRFGLFGGERRLDVLLAERLSRHRLAKAVRGSKFALCLLQNKR